jgi:preprotein translocase subunit SecE
VTNEVKKNGRFFKNVRAELKKVSWPTRSELKDYTIVVLTVCFITTVGIYLFDTIFRGVLRLFI